MIIVAVRNIQWDTEQEDGSRPDQDELGLPEQFILEVDEVNDDQISNALSDEFGYCVFDWDYA